MNTARPPEDFERLTGPLRPELLAHCYRMLGSATEAEDQVQETYLRAWRSFHRFEERASVRTWMYKIATNTCLTALEGRSKRPLPTRLGQPSSDPHEPVIANEEILWLEPLPDAMLADPSDRAVAREEVGLAMVAALQDLPPKQRATLILRDVLQFSAMETAELLQTSVASANSALQRARATVGDGARREGRKASELDEHEKKVWDAFCAAFERHDIDSLVGVLAADATWEMPPFTGWYVGAQSVIDLAKYQCPASAPGDLRMIPTTCNGLPAAGMYLRNGGVWEPFQLDVLVVRAGTVQHVAAFFGKELFTLAGLPDCLPSR